MKKTSQQYLNSEAHGYLMEAKACKLLLKDLERIRAKLRRHIEKEAADRKAEFEAAMEYHSESDIQEAYGWEFISEQQYERYLELFRQGRKALDEHSPTVTELALSILNRIFQDIDRDCRQCEFEALSPEEQLAELKRAEESRQAWRQYIASLKEMINIPSRYNVILHNDNKTTFDFVILVLTSIFRHNRESAAKIADVVDNQGKEIVGTYSKEIATEKIREAEELAVKNKFPLQLSMEQI
jgi:ATP-dependent Clp protease adapter protein ClpS